MGTPKKLSTALRKIRENEDGIRRYIADYVLEYRQDDEEIKSFFHDLLSHGCCSGMVTGLICHADTWQFFDRFYEEIEELRNDFESEIGEPLRIEHDLKNFFAWFAFEETAFRLANELDIEV